MLKIPFKSETAAEAKATQATSGKWMDKQTNRYFGTHEESVADDPTWVSSTSRDRRSKVQVKNTTETEAGTNGSKIHVDRVNRP